MEPVLHDVATYPAMPPEGRGGSAFFPLLAIFLALFLFAFGCKYLQYLTFQSNDFDSGIYSNLAWNIAAGKGYYSDVLQVNHFAHHFSPIMYLIAPFYLIKDSVLVVYFFMALTYAATFVVLFHVYRHILGGIGHRFAVATAVLLIILFFSQPLNSALFHEFHPSTMALPFIALAILGLHGKNFWIVTIGVVLLLCTKENSCLAVAGLGLYAWLVLGDRRTGWVLFLVALVYTLVIFKVFMPMFREGAWGHMSRLKGSPEVYRKLRYLVSILAAFCFLPVFAPRVLLCAVPLIGVNLIVSYKAQFSLRFQYDDMVCVFLAVASAYGLRNLLALFEASKKRNLVIALCVALVVCGVYVDRRNVRFTRVHSLIVKAAREDYRQLWRELAPYMADKSIPVLASTDLGPLLSCRERFRTIMTEAALEEGRRDGDLSLVRTYEGKLPLDSMAADDVALASPIAGTWGLWDGFYDAIRNDGRYVVVHDTPVLFVFKRAPDAGVQPSL